MARDMPPPDRPYGVTLYTEDLAVLFCLRGLATRNGFPAMTGTGKNQWRENGRTVTFYFTTGSSRDDFLADAERLLSGRWKIR